MTQVVLCPRPVCCGYDVRVKSRKYLGVFEAESPENRSLQALEKHRNTQNMCKSQQGRDQVSGGVSVQSYHATSVANIVSEYTHCSTLYMHVHNCYIEFIQESAASQAGDEAVSSCAFGVNSGLTFVSVLVTVHPSFCILQLFMKPFKLDVIRGPYAMVLSLCPRKSSHL